METQGAIELPGEANPLTEGLLYHTLRSASSSDPQQIQTGTKQLQSWETEKGYYSLLQSVFLDKTLPLEVRYLSIIQLKNGIDKYWRKTAKNAITKEEKVVIRSRLYESGVNEADERLALQNALVVAKIIRLDYPTEWPDALSKLIAVLRTAAAPESYRLHLPRTLLILLQVVKELATGRLIRTRQNLQSVTPEIFQVLGTIYMDKVQRWQSFLRDGGDDEGGALDDIEQSLLAMKVLRRLLVAGYEFPNRDDQLHGFWSIVRNQLGDLLPIVTMENSPLAPHVRQLIEKHLAQFAKLHLEMAKTHPAAFVLLPDSLNLVRAYWSLIAAFGDEFGIKTFPPIADAALEAPDDDEKPIKEVLCQKGLLLIRACLKMVFNPAQTFRYRHPEEKEEKAKATEIVKSQLLTAEFVRELMEITVTRFFVFRARDFAEWQDEPEEWENSQTSSGDEWEFSIRPCAEKLFLDLAINFKDMVTQPLLNVFYNIASPDNQDIRAKDSIYTAIGLAAPVVHQQLDFDSFITATLVQEVQKDGPGYNILRRRIAILLAQWISVKISEEKRPVVYQIYQHLLDRSSSTNDIVVRITAGREFKNIADEWDFKAGEFMPYCPETLSRIMSLIEEVTLSETKMALLHSISTLVVRLEHHIIPYADRIVNLLPPLWEQSGEEHLMKQAILTILSRLITSMKAESRPYHPLVLPIIKGAVEPGSDTQVYLLEDALDLWSSVISQTNSPASPELLSLAPHLLHILELGSEAFRNAIEIFESYVLLAPSDVLADNLRTPLLTSLATLLGTLKPDANGVVTHLVEIIVRAAEGVGGDQAVQILVGDMINTTFFAKLMFGLKGSWNMHQRAGLRLSTSDPVVDGVVETDYFSLLARISIASPQILLEAIKVAVTEESLESTMKWLLEEWFSHFENIGDPTRKKLMVLALTRLLETGADWILIKLQDLMVVWTDVVNELTEGYDDKSVDGLVYPPPEVQNEVPEAPEEVRRRDALYSDAVHTINLVAFIRDHLKAAVAGAGGEQAFQESWLVNVDKEVVQGFMKVPGLS